MKIRFSLVHVITCVLISVSFTSAQMSAPSAQIATLTLDPQRVSVLHLKRGFVTSIRLPDPVSSVVLGDPTAFHAEHSEAEPQLVFVKPTTVKPARTNVLITTRAGREVSLTLVSEGTPGSDEAVDYVLRYEPQRTFLIASARPTFVIGETRPTVEPLRAATGKAEPRGLTVEQKLLQQQEKELPQWQGKPLQVAVGMAEENGEKMAVPFSVLNSSAKTIELLPPQIQLAGRSKSKHGKVKAEPVPIKSYDITSRRLASGARADGVVIFERPSFKESRERLLLQIAQAEEVDRPVLVPIAFVAPRQGGLK